MSPTFICDCFLSLIKNALGVLFYFTELQSHHTAFLQIMTSSSFPKIKKKKLILNMYWPERRTKGVWQILIITDDHNAWNSFLHFGSNKASSYAVLMGAGLHSCVPFFLFDWGLFESFSCKLLDWQLFFVSPHSCACAHTQVCVCVQPKTSGYTRGWYFKERTSVFFKRGNTTFLYQKSALVLNLSQHCCIITDSSVIIC